MIYSSDLARVCGTIVVELSTFLYQREVLPHDCALCDMVPMAIGQFTCLRHEQEAPSLCFFAPFNQPMDRDQLVACFEKPGGDPTYAAKSSLIDGGGQQS